METLDAKLRFPHFETNEDGRVNRHAGYTLKLCKACNKFFIVGNERADLRDICGHKECEQCE